MKKILLIGWKDLTLTFRDRAALIFMLAAPFALTVGLGLVTGSFTSISSGGVSMIPVALVNQDDGALGGELVKLFQSEALADLVTATVYSDLQLAHLEVDQDRAAALVLVPAGFTESITAGPDGSAEVVQVSLYLNPSRPNSAGVIEEIVAAFLNQVELGRTAGKVVVTQLLENGLVEPQQAGQVGGEIGARWQQEGRQAREIAVHTVTAPGDQPRFNPLAVMAPSMALMFLMFTVSNGGRMLLNERSQGTLPRLLISPTTHAQILGGKVLGLFLTGAAQMLILISGTALAFGVNWGSPLAVLVLVLAAVTGAVGWGLLITTLAKSPGQVSTVGTVLMLLFGILGGAFINLENMPVWMQWVSKITPNAWGLNGFTTLALGGGLGDILSPVLALLAMGALLFTLSAIIFKRRGFNL
jgi:ABC-2 type transport system permease protein